MLFHKRSQIRYFYKVYAECAQGQNFQHQWSLCKMCMTQGRGLNLKEKTSGYYILIASDMGITAYIDFISFLLQKTLHDLIKAKASSPSLRKISAGNNNRY